jgi:hypothetical protein
MARRPHRRPPLPPPPPPPLPLSTAARPRPSCQHSARSLSSLLFLLASDLAASMPIVDNPPQPSPSPPTTAPNCPPLPAHGHAGHHHGHQFPSAVRRPIDSPAPLIDSLPSSAAGAAPAPAAAPALALLQWPISASPSAATVQPTSASLSAAGPASGPSDPSTFPALFSLDTLRSRLRQLHQRTSATAQSTPVLVTAYSGPRPSPFRFASRAAMAVSGPVSSLPPVSNFSFSHILLTIDSQIQDPLEAISEICARSRLSLADEYGAHLPPQGEIRDGNSVPIRGRGGLFLRTAGFPDSGLSVVHEASSSSASEAGTMRSAYGSLRDVLTKGSSQADPSSAADAKTTNPSSSWAIMKRGKESIVLMERPRSSRHISTDPIIERSQNGDQTLEPLSSSLSARPQAVSSWIPWRRASATGSSSGIERPTAASALKTLLGETQPALDMS